MNITDKNSKSYLPLLGAICGLLWDQPTSFGKSELKNMISIPFPKDLNSLMTQ